MTIEIIADDFQESYPVNELRDAFDLVKDPSDWKKLINAWIDKDKLNVVKEAVRFFTATDAKVVEERGDRVRIFAVGYYMGPAGP